MKHKDAKLERRAEDRRRESLLSLGRVLNSVDGKDALYYLVNETGVFSYMWDPSSRLHYLAGRRDFGLWMMNEMAQANEPAFFDMQRSAWARAKEDRLDEERLQKEDR